MTIYFIILVKLSSIFRGLSCIVSNHPGETGTSSPITESYNTATGYLASTTGNISGVYDMSGGSTEYMAAYVDSFGVVNSQGINSGFTEETSEKYKIYLNRYQSKTGWYSYENRILGDATGEMGPFYYYSDDYLKSHNSWYGDRMYLVQGSFPWFQRGGDYNEGVLAGQFSTNSETGGDLNYVGSRLVLAPKK